MGRVEGTSTLRGRRRTPRRPCPFADGGGQGEPEPGLSQVTIAFEGRAKHHVGGLEIHRDEVGLGDPCQTQGGRRGILGVLPESAGRGRLQVQVRDGCPVGEVPGEDDAAGFGLVHSATAASGRPPRSRSATRADSSEVRLQDGRAPSRAKEVTESRASLIPQSGKTCLRESKPPSEFESRSTAQKSVSRLGIGESACGIPRVGRTRPTEREVLCLVPEQSAGRTRPSTRPAMRRVPRGRRAPARSMRRMRSVHVACLRRSMAKPMLTSPRTPRRPRRLPSPRDHRDQPGSVERRSRSWGTRPQGPSGASAGHRRDRIEIDASPAGVDQERPWRRIPFRGRAGSTGRPSGPRRRPTPDDPGSATSQGGCRSRRSPGWVLPGVDSMKGFRPGTLWKR